MTQGPQKLILIHSGKYDFAEVDLNGSLQIVGPNNAGKTTLINTLQFLYLDDRGAMEFGNHTPEQTRDYYFPDQYSYILFQCLGSKGQFVLGWRGLSRAASTMPHRFVYDGPFDKHDFLDENGVREVEDVNARLSLKRYVHLQGAKDHREILLRETKGDSQGRGLVSLRDNDKYPQFKETLKNLLSLSTISQAAMSKSLLMLAGLSSDKYALDVREVFGEDYDRIRRRKEALLLFKGRELEIKALIASNMDAQRLSGELAYQWRDLREKQQASEGVYRKKRADLEKEVDGHTSSIVQLSTELESRRSESQGFFEHLGGLRTRLSAIERQRYDLRDFSEELTSAALENLEAEIQLLGNRLVDAKRDPRVKVEEQLSRAQSSLIKTQHTLRSIDRALINVLRKHFVNDELTQLTRLLNYGLLTQPIGVGGIELLDEAGLVQRLRLLKDHIKDGSYRDETIAIPLPEPDYDSVTLDDAETLRVREAEEREMISRIEVVLAAIKEKEALMADLEKAKEEQRKLLHQEYAWREYMKAFAEQPRIEAELKKTEEQLAKVTANISLHATELERIREAKTTTDKNLVISKTSFESGLARFNQCRPADLDRTEIVPEEPLPFEFASAAERYIEKQKRHDELKIELRNGLRGIEQTVGSDYAGTDDDDTIRILSEEIDALPDKEHALRQEWENHFHQLRGQFDEVLRDLDLVRTATEQMNRSFRKVQVSNLKTIQLQVEEQADTVGMMRRLGNVEHPGLFDDSTNLESSLNSFRQKFDANPLLYYTDLFKLRFTVTGDDNKTHHYNDLKQVESHGTTVTIRVIFSLLVLRRLLREDSVTKEAQCRVPFFLDEVHSLDSINRRAILVTAEKLGFIAITASPEHIGEVDAWYFLQPQHGRVKLDHHQRITVRQQLQEA